MNDAVALPDTTHLGPVTLSVDDHDAVRSYYTDTVGLEVVTATDDSLGLGVEDQVLLRLRERPDADARPATAAGLFHVAIRVPDRSALADAASRLLAAERLQGASDHGVSEALYSRDPAGNGIEVYRDRPRSSWPMQGDRVSLITEPLDVQALRRESTAAGGLPESTDIGHVHLEVTDLKRAVDFYVDAIGFAERDRYRGARFVAAGGYHHHVGLNTWNGRSTPASGLGALEFTVYIDAVEALDGVIDRLEARDIDVERGDDGVTVDDPDGITIRLRIE